MENSRFSLLNNFKDSYIAAVIIPTVAINLIAVCSLILAYKLQWLSIELIILFSMLVAFLTVVVFVIFVSRTLCIIIKQEKSEQILTCKNCASDYKKYIFHRYHLLSFDEVVAREKKIKNHPEANQCVVYNFTTLGDTFQSEIDEYNGEEKITDVIKNNILAGVTYKVFYTNEMFVQLGNKNQELYGEENLIPYVPSQSIDRVAEFDYLIHRTPETLDCYVSICFSSDTGYCGSCKHKPCDYINDYLFYKKLPTTESLYIYQKLTKEAERYKKQSQKARR